MAEEQNLQIQETEKQEVESDVERTRARKVFVPRVDIYETDDGIAIVADMPGVTQDSVEIMLEKNVLSINGAVQANAPQEYSLTYAEYQVGDYERRFSLSAEIDQDRIEAKIKDGVLYLHLPKISPTTKKIAVKSG